MTVKKRIKRLLRGRNLREVAEGSGVPYHVVVYFNGRVNPKLDVDEADRLLKFLEKGQ